MQNLLSFNFLAILNLFVILLWPASGYYMNSRPGNPAGNPPRMNVLGIIMLILTVIAVILDILFMAVALVR